MPVETLQLAVTGYSLVGAAVIVTAGALGDGVRPTPHLPRWADPVRPLLRADRTVDERVGGDRRTRDPGGGRIDHPRLRAEPALCRQHREGAVARRVPVGRGLGHRRRARSARGRTAWSGSGAGKDCSGSMRSSPPACIPLTLLTVAESRDPTRSPLHRLRGVAADRVDARPDRPPRSAWGPAGAGCRSRRSGASRWEWPPRRVRAGRASSHRSADRPEDADERGPGRCHHRDPDRRGARSTP